MMIKICVPVAVSNDIQNTIYAKRIKISETYLEEAEVLSPVPYDVK
jgi:hypothetical protein